ncbi:SRPBCC family protein [Pseudoprimorskyibacter insulae]|uniref:Activator of Hsp90 ATPase homologue 1/2-like C-terminal domain-containing protein n=1 Tax=Pseudoprimorskyibacter insulae TaxID=1695997 RepID=A0A2R8AVP8_9RHOB|nr:SRPBCC family protein [Pseudoprimorskyibacter insulae]SPF80017.1 hypothetical protein PRI8871_01819 [Pseudoprimorskyibacter insulae]
MTQFNPVLDLELVRHIKASPETIYRCWTEPSLLEQWFCPKPWCVTDADIDPRPGGRFNFIMRGPEGEEVPYRTCFLEVIPNQKLVSTDALSEGYRPNDKVFLTSSITLTPQDGGTLYRAIAMHNTVEAKDQHEKMGFHDGWGAAATQLEDLAKSL